MITKSNQPQSLRQSRTSPIPTSHSTYSGAASSSSSNCKNNNYQSNKTDEKNDQDAAHQENNLKKENKTFKFNESAEPYFLNELFSANTHFIIRGSAHAFYEKYPQGWTSLTDPEKQEAIRKMIQDVKSFETHEDHPPHHQQMNNSQDKPTLLLAKSRQKSSSSTKEKSSIPPNGDVHVHGCLRLLYLAIGIFCETEDELEQKNHVQELSNLLLTWKIHDLAFIYLKKLIIEANKQQNSSLPSNGHAVNISKKSSGSSTVSIGFQRQITSCLVLLLILVEHMTDNNDDDSGEALHLEESNLHNFNTIDHLNSNLKESGYFLFKFKLSLYLIQNISGYTEAKIHKDCVMETTLALLCRILFKEFGKPHKRRILHAQARTKEGLELWPTPEDNLSSHRQKSKCLPHDIHTRHVYLTQRFPQFILPDVKSICKRDVWLGLYPISICTKSALMDCSPGIHLNVSEQLCRFTNHPLPKFIQEMFETMHRNLYIPLSAVQMHNVIQELDLEQRMGFSVSDSKTKINNNNDPIVDLNYTSLLKRSNVFCHQIVPQLPTFLSSLLRLLFEINISNGRSKQQEDECKIQTYRRNELLNKHVTGIIHILLKMLKSFHFIAFEHACSILSENNGLLLLLKILSLTFPAVNNVTRIIKREDFRNSRVGLSSGKPNSNDEDLDDVAPVNLHFLSERSSVKDPGFYSVCCSLKQWFHVTYGLKIEKSSCTPSELDLSLVGSETYLSIVENSSTDSSATDATLNGVQDDDSVSYVDNVPKEINTCYRAFYTTLNLLRILQKMTKSKYTHLHSLVQWKAIGVFKRILLLLPSHPQLDKYACKLIKSQLALMGKKWKKMDTNALTHVNRHIRLRLFDECLQTIQIDSREPTQLLPRSNSRSFSSDRRSSYSSSGQDETQLQSMLTGDYSPYHITISEIRQIENQFVHLRNFWMEKNYPSSLNSSALGTMNEHLLHIDNDQEYDKHHDVGEDDAQISSENNKTLRESHNLENKTDGFRVFNCWEVELDDIELHPSFYENVDAWVDQYFSSIEA